MARSDSAGNIVRFDYQPWGEPWTAPATAAGDRQYNGRVFDQGTGFHDYGARMYWSEIGRFISVDTAGPSAAVPATFNRYAYVLNNPYKYVDPTGKWFEPVLAWRWPDFSQININVSIPTPWTGTIIGWSGTVSIDRFGNWYWSVLGAGAGKSPRALSGSITANWIVQGPTPSEEQLKNFMTGNSVNVTVGYLGGASVTVSPGNGWAWGAGLVTPQAGVGYNYSFQGNDDNNLIQNDVNDEVVTPQDGVSDDYSYQGNDNNDFFQTCNNDEVNW